MTLQPATCKLQPSLRTRRVLLGVDAVSALRSLMSSARVYDLVDTGDLLWAFDLSTKFGRGRNRELRFWTREIIAPETTIGLELDDVLRLIIPRRDQPGQSRSMRQWQVGELLWLSKRNVIELRRELGGLDRAGEIFIPCKSLETFLRRRWCGAIPGRAALPRRPI